MLPVLRVSLVVALSGCMSLPVASTRTVVMLLLWVAAFVVLLFADVVVLLGFSFHAWRVRVVVGVPADTHGVAVAVSLLPRHQAVQP